jgi:hypothetical protein
MIRVCVSLGFSNINLTSLYRDGAQAMKQIKARADGRLRNASISNNHIAKAWLKWLTNFWQVA